jgi:hypothetical protein
MWFARKKHPPVTPEDALDARPARLPGADFQAAATGGGRVTVILRPTGWGRALLRMPTEAKKTFELDAIGVFVWEHCDGKTSVRQIIKKLAKQYNLNLREAQVPTLQFLHTLSRRGLIGLSVKGKARQ